MLTCLHQRCLKNKAYHGSCLVALYLNLNNIVTYSKIYNGL